MTCDQTNNSAGYMANTQNTIKQLKAARMALKGLTVYRNFLKDPLGSRLLAILESPVSELLSDSEFAVIYDKYNDLIRGLMDHAASGAYPGAVSNCTLGDIWRDYLLDFIISDMNPFSIALQSAGLHDIHPMIRTAAAGEIDLFQTVICPILSNINRFIGANLHGLNDDTADELGDKPSNVQCDEFMPGISLDRYFISETGIFSYRSRLKSIIASSEDWSSAMEELASYIREIGQGPIGRSYAFRWNARKSGLDRIEPISNPDPIKLDDLIGYQDQKEQLIDNTERLLRGLPAHNLLLYGERGTGKSSMIKAIAGRYADKGLKLIEIRQSDLRDLDEVIRTLKGNNQSFILFVDDLSFDEGQNDYKALKSLLEGGIESRPANIAVYATSNRRHLVKEFFSDSKPALSFNPAQDEEIHAMDTVEEKLSLSDRFGKTITFLSPDKEHYIGIVKSLARQKGIQIDEERLVRMALEWEMRHSGRSGRTARQFIDEITGREYRQ